MKKTLINNGSCIVCGRDNQGSSSTKCMYIDCVSNQTVENYNSFIIDTKIIELQSKLDKIENQAKMYSGLKFATFVIETIKGNNNE